MVCYRFAFSARALAFGLVTCIATARAEPPKSGCGRAGCGTVFSFDLKTGKEKVLHSFVRKGDKDGYSPLSALTPIGNALFGTAELGGSSRSGIVFSVDRISGAETIVHSFRGGGDGIYPDAGLMKLAGLLYGTTSYGGGESCGGSGCGTLFSVDPGTGTVTVLHAFVQNGTDGNVPEDTPLALGGILYGTTLSGGSASFSCGTVFSVDPAKGTETVLYSFQFGSDGAYPYAGLTKLGGTLYGTTSYGGVAQNGGTVFSIDPSTGAEAVVYRFQRQSGDGFSPYAGLDAMGGLLYGTTCSGGASDAGIVFALDPGSGTETVLHSFQNSDGNCPGGLINVGGTLYGSTGSGGPYGDGTLFSITTAGVETTLHSFSGRDGRGPAASLRFVRGKFYGTTAEGGHDG